MKTEFSNQGESVLANELESASKQTIESANNQEAENVNPADPFGISAPSVSAPEAPLSAPVEKPFLRVYRKKSTFPGAKPTDYWYSGTRSDGTSVTVIFKCGIPQDYQNEGAFEITDVIGTAKKETVEKGNEVYTNFKYYITSCNFREVVGGELPL